MIYRLVNKNTFLPFVLLPFMVILLWGKTLFFSQTPPVSNIDAQMPLYGLISPYLTGTKLTAALVGLFFAFLVTIGINRFNANFLLLKRQSMAAGYLFLILISAFTSLQVFQPIWIFVLLFVLAIHRLFLASGNKDATIELFNAAFLISISALFYSKALFYVPLLFWVSALLNFLSFRGFWALLMGLLLPLAMALGLSYVTGVENELIVAARESLLHTAPSYHFSILNYIYIGLVVCYILLSLIMVIGRLNNMKILNRKYYRALMAITLYAMMLGFTPFFSIEVLPVIAFGAAYLLAQFFDTLKSAFWLELFFGLLLFITFAVQLGPR